MLKKNVLIVILCICMILSCSCSRDDANNVEQTVENSGLTENDNRVSIDDLPVIRYPVLSETDNYDYTDYYQSGLLLPSKKSVIDQNKSNKLKNISFAGVNYTLTYLQTRDYKNDSSDFLKAKGYDEYESVDGKISVDYHKDGEHVKILYFKWAGLDDAPVLVNDFSELTLKNAAISVLNDLYGEKINDYLNSYYRFEYAQLFEYTKTELNRYVVGFRAYLNDIPTDDAIYVHITLEGKLDGVSARNYLQYLNYKTDNLFSLEALNTKLNEFVGTFGYDTVSPRTIRFPYQPSYYQMNSEGELYYVSELDCRKDGGSHLEAFAIKAE